MARKFYNHHWSFLPALCTLALVGGCFESQIKPGVHSSKPKPETNEIIEKIKDELPPENDTEQTSSDTNNSNQSNESGGTEVLTPTPELSLQCESNFSDTAQNAIIPTIRITLIDPEDDYPASGVNVTVALKQSEPGQKIGGTLTQMTLQDKAEFDDLRLNFTSESVVLVFGIDNGPTVSCPTFKSTAPAFSDFFIITDWEDLANIGNNLSANYLLANDLTPDSNGYLEIASETANGGLGWIPIGLGPVYFSGSLDGDNHVIEGLISNRDTYGTGLFSRIETEGTVRNLHLRNVNIIGGNWSVSGLVGHLEGTLDNCSVTGFVKTKNSPQALGNVGALAGFMSTTGVIQHSWSNAHVTSNLYTGGLVGISGGRISSSFAAGKVSPHEQASNRIGGFAGEVTTGGIIENSWAKSTVLSLGGDWVGGFIGRMFDGTLRENYSVGKVLGNEPNTHGFLGASAGSPVRQNNFWDEERSEITKAGFANTSPLTTASMQGTAAETNLTGFNFGADWESISTGKVLSTFTATEDYYPLIPTIDYAVQLSESPGGFFVKLFSPWNDLDFSSSDYLEKLDQTFNYSLTPSATTFENLAGSGKWWGGILAPNGMIYGVPRNSDNILKIDPKTDTVNLFGSFSGTSKWAGGVLAPNGMIYTIPRDSSTILKIDPRDDSTEEFGDLPGSGKWIGGVLARNGYIYGIPYNADNVLKIDPATDSATTIGNIARFDNKWIGGTLAPNGNIYAFPDNTSSILKIEPATDTVSALFFTELSSGFTKYYGSVLAPNGKIYGIPMNAANVAIFDPETETIELISTNLGSGGFKWTGGALGANGKIYGMPLNSTSFLEIDPTDNSVTTFGTAPGSGAWVGGITTTNGFIYGIPSNSTSILKLGDKELDLELDALLSPHLNKW